MRHVRTRDPARSAAREPADRASCQFRRQGGGRARRVALTVSIHSLRPSATPRASAFEEHVATSTEKPDSLPTRLQRSSECLRRLRAKNMNSWTPCPDAPGVCSHPLEADAPEVFFPGVAGTLVAPIFSWPPSGRPKPQTPERLAADIADVERAAFGSSRPCVRDRPSRCNSAFTRCLKSPTDHASILDFVLDICGISMHVGFIAMG
jgi:hypothetical protein